jgi:DNA (cytosine-5)-methyltransferase 1
MQAAQSPTLDKLSTNTPTMISLFAGAGGLDIGLEQAGFISIAINELGPDACESLRKNKELSQLHDSNFDAWFDEQIAGQKCYSRAGSEAFIASTRSRLRAAADTHAHLDKAVILENDIRSILSDELLKASGTRKGEVFLVAGGPPCQPFSRAGKRETVETGDGQLFLEFVRIVDEIRPRWFLFENVKGLTQSKTIVPYVYCDQCKHETIVPFAQRAQVIISKEYNKPCSACGNMASTVHCKDLKGGSLNIILNEFESIGYKCYFNVLNAADYGVPQSRERLFIVGTRDRENFVWPEPTNQGTKKGALIASNAIQLDLLDGIISKPTKKPWVTVKDVLWKNGHPEYGQLDYSKAVLWVKNVVRPHDEPVTWSLDRVSPTIGAHQGAKLAIAPFGVPDEQLARQQWHVLGKRQSDMPPVPVIHSMLTDEELLLLQTFPLDWYLHGTRMERAFQIGNAVPPMFAKAVGKAILAASGINQINNKVLRVKNGNSIDCV